MRLSYKQAYDIQVQLSTGVATHANAEDVENSADDHQQGGLFGTPGCSKEAMLTTCQQGASVTCNSLQSAPASINHPNIWHGMAKQDGYAQFQALHYTTASSRPSRRVEMLSMMKHVPKFIAEQQDAKFWYPGQSSPRSSMDLQPQSITHITTNHTNRARSVDCIQASQAINENRRKSHSMSRCSQLVLRRSLNSNPVPTSTENSDNADEWQSLDHLITHPSMKSTRALESLTSRKEGWTEKPLEHITPQLSPRSRFCLLGELNNVPLAPVVVPQRRSNAETFYAGAIVCGALNRLAY